MDSKKMKYIFAAALIFFTVPYAAVATAGVMVEGVNVERKVNHWLGMVDAAKYDEAAQWLIGSNELLADYTLSAKALRALHASHGPTASRFLVASEVESDSFDRAFEVKVDTTFISNGTATELVRIGVKDGQWSIWSYEVSASDE